MLFEERRSAVSRTVWILIVVVAVAAVAGVEYSIGLGTNPGTNGTREIDIQIIEDNPVLQIDHFYPATVFVLPNQNISLAVLNTDDETRVFTLSQFNINLTMASGTTQRINFQANHLGNFSFISPKAPPSAVSQGRPAKCLQGYFVVTQNATLVSTTSTSGSGVAGSTYCANPLA